MNRNSRRKPVCIGGRLIGDGFPPLIIAEMSGNHNGSLERALALVDAAAEAGAHALKLQTYTADSLTIDCEGPDFVIDDPGSPWRGETLYGLYGKASTPWEWHGAIFARCREKGMICFSTPFDAAAVDFLASLGAPAYKIASFENADFELIGKAASTGKPLIMSTGMATLAELQEAVLVARAAGCRELILLKCTSAYPAAPEDANLRSIPDLMRRFDCEVGLSDHTMGIGTAVAAVALGSSVIEKHLTLSRAEGGVDAAFSLEPTEFKELVYETERAWLALGKPSYGPTRGEAGSLRFRRSLYVVKDMKADEILSGENLRAIRPGFGLTPKHKDALLGMTVLTDIKRGTPMSWGLVGKKAPDEKLSGLKVYFLVNEIAPFALHELCEKHLPGVAIESGSKLPQDSEGYALIVPWNYRRILAEHELRPNFMVFHASDLPEGKGWATIYHAIAREQAVFTITGFIPDAKMDEGTVVVKARFPLKPNYTAKILRRHQEEVSIILLRGVLERFGGKPPMGRKTGGAGTVYKRRRPEDNEIDVAKPFSEIVPHLRACESGHPAFFSNGGEKFIVTVTPENEPDFPEDLKVKFF